MSSKVQQMQDQLENKAHAVKSKQLELTNYVKDMQYLLQGLLLIRKVQEQTRYLERFVQLPLQKIEKYSSTYEAYAENNANLRREIAKYKPSQTHDFYYNRYIALLVIKCEDNLQNFWLPRHTAALNAVKAKYDELLEAKQRRRGAETQLGDQPEAKRKKTGHLFLKTEIA